MSDQSSGKGNPPGVAGAGRSGDATGLSQAGTESVVSRFPTIEACGPPSRPLLEAILLFAAFYLVAYLPSDPSAGRSLGTVRFYFLLLFDLVPKACVVLYLMARSEGLGAFGLAKPRFADIPRGTLVALGALALVAAPSFVLAALGLRNPLLEASTGSDTAAYLLVPLILLSSLVVGYGEELFFRSYLIRRLGQSGLPPPWAMIASSLVFGSAHGLQGPLGVALGSMLGMWFGWRWLRAHNIHEIAIGHAIYDAAVIIITLYR